jgi:cytochrome c-type biogenesis protein CcmH/NrfG
MAFAILLAAVVLAAVAAVGILRPWTRPGGPSLERLADPLDDERRGLLRTLRDLEEERSTGALGDETYRLLRAETEVRAVAVLRALEARDGSGTFTADLADVRAARRTTATSGNGQVASHAATPKRRLFVGLGVVVVGLGVIVPLLAHAVGSRQSGAPITGTTLPTPSDPLAYFEQRVHEHPNDLAARLDLGQRYLQVGNVQGAITQYLAALRIDPSDPDARATLGFLLFRAGHPQDGLRAIRQALAVDPTFPEALYYEGIVELEGLHDANAARQAFEAYLTAAPFGSHVAEVRRYLQQAASPSPSASPSG